MFSSSLIHGWKWRDNYMLITMMNVASISVGVHQTTHRSAREPDPSGTLQSGCRSPDQEPTHIERRRHKARLSATMVIIPTRAKAGHQELLPRMLRHRNRTTLCGCTGRGVHCHRRTPARSVARTDANSRLERCQCKLYWNAESKYNEQWLIFVCKLHSVLKMMIYYFHWIVVWWLLINEFTDQFVNFLFLRSLHSRQSDIFVWRLSRLKFSQRNQTRS